MKNLLITATAILAAMTLSAQAPKLLNLEQSSAKAFETGLINDAQKQQIDSLITIYNVQRAEINKVRKSLSKQELDDKVKKMSGDFNNGLKKIIGNAGYSKWMDLRKDKE